MWEHLHSFFNFSSYWPNFKLTEDEDFMMKDGTNISRIFQISTDLTYYELSYSL